MKKKVVGLSLLAVLVLAVGAGVGWWLQREDASAVQYRTGNLERGPLSAAVSASGAVNPVSLVTVGTQVSGQIKDIYVDFNSEVKAGQLIAQIDPETFEYRLRSAQADLDAARAAVLTAQANMAAARAGVSRAQTDLAEAQRSHARNLSLVSMQFIAQSEADRSNALVNTSVEALKSAQAQLGVNEAQVQSAQANVAQRQAALAQARVDLARTRITSPINGIVVKRAIEKGQTVAASLQSPELFVIAQNLSDMQVDASVDEADVGRIRPGQKASFTVDAFPGRNFEGEVRQVRKAAVNVANVVTYVVVVGFNNSNGQLLPGMTANVRVITDQRESVLKVPNAALRVRIAGVEPVDATKSGANSQDGTRGLAKNPALAASEPAAASAAPGASGGAGGTATGSAGGAGGPAAEFRNRLVKELGLSAEQTQKVDAIYADVRPRFMALRDLPQEERGKARERISADVRARISEFLTPEQKARYGSLVAEAAGRQTTRGRIHLLGEDGKPRAYNVRLGITDGTSTELLVSPNAPDAALFSVGTPVITGVIGAATAAARAPGGNTPRLAF